jgi:uncharacterized protein
MIAQFSVGNFLSFKNPQTISFDATSLKDTTENVVFDSNFQQKGLLKSLSIQGSNSSGKSNLLKAFEFMKFWVVNSFNESNKTMEIPVQPYLLDNNSTKKNSSFEVIFYVDDLRYRYGFSLNKQFVDEEWLLYAEPKKREQHYFIRKSKEVTYNNYWKKNSPIKIDPIITYVKPSVLFISALAQFNIDIGKLIIGWFNKNLVAYDLSSDYFINRTASLIKDTEYFIAIHHLIEKAKLGFKTFDAEVIGKYKNTEKFDKDFLAFAFQENLENYRIQTKHEIYNENDKKIGQILFDLRKQESTGTQKFFALAGIILSTIKNKEIIWVDELDSKFHPALFYTIIKFFNSNKFNHKGAQLIFTTHNTQLLKDRSLRRDQIYTIDKSEFGESTINGAFKSNVRMDISYEKQYFDGKYGGIEKINLEDSQLDLF